MDLRALAKVRKDLLLEVWGPPIVNHFRELAETNPQNWLQKLIKFRLHRKDLWVRSILKNRMLCLKLTRIMSKDKARPLMPVSKIRVWTLPKVDKIIYLNPLLAWTVIFPKMTSLCCNLGPKLWSKLTTWLPTRSRCSGMAASRCTLKRLCQARTTKRSWTSCWMWDKNRRMIPNLQSRSSMEVTPKCASEKHSWESKSTNKKNLKGSRRSNKKTAKSKRKICQMWKSRKTKCQLSKKIWTQLLTFWSTMLPPLPPNFYKVCPSAPCTPSMSTVKRVQKRNNKVWHF